MTIAEWKPCGESKQMFYLKISTRVRQYEIYLYKAIYLFEWTVKVEFVDWSTYEDEHPLGIRDCEINDFIKTIALRVAIEKIKEMDYSAHVLTLENENNTIA